MEEIKIRKSVFADLKRLTEIYNQAIESRRCTCDLRTLTEKEREGWFSEHCCERFPLYSLVCGENVIGYVSLSPYKQREALRDVAEVTYYLDFSYRAQGLGSRMLSFILDEAKRLGFSTVIGVIVGCNDASSALLHKFGFEEWGRMPRTADYGNRLEDHVYLGKHLY